MTIPARVLSRWTNQGATTNSSNTYSPIQKALENSRYGLERDDFDHSYEIHLQGSYANDTNIHGTSDVDIVARVTMPFEEDLTDLTPAEQERFWDRYTDISYEWGDFYSRVQRALRGYFGRNNIDIGDKAIKVKSGEESPIPKDADVVACADYRKYSRFSPKGEEEYVTGMFFRTQSTGRPIVNYSKRHRDHGTAKNKTTNGYYKPTIRMFKNAKNTAIDRGWIPMGTVSSYYLEGLLYNVPNDKFMQTDFQDRYQGILNWLQEANIGAFPEQSEMYPLCEASNSDRWSVEEATVTVEGLLNLWNYY